LKQMKKLLVTVALGAVMAATPALAQDQGAGRGWMKDQTRQQAQQRADMLFQMLDANKDGTVTKAEAEQALARFQAARGGDNGRGGGRMQRMIEDAFSTTPSISLAQFEAQALARFDAQDLNHDGVVSAAEKQQLRAQRQAQKPGQ
jgi:Ca2+-binding EF-hand superfamily protein